MLLLGYPTDKRELALPNVEKYIPKDLYNSAKEVLENVSKINDPV